MNNVERKAYAEKIAKLSTERLKQKRNALIQEAEFIKDMIYRGISTNVEEDWQTVEELETKAYLIEIELLFR